MKNKIILSLGVLIVFGFSFYWFDLRPKQIRAECSNESREKVSEATKKAGTSEGLYEGYDFLYKICIRNKGLRD